MDRNLKKWIIIAIIVAAVGYNIYQASKLRPGAKAPDQRPNAVICTECGWTGFRPTLKLPQECPRCHNMSVHFAGICPECGAWTPWELWKEELLYEKPRLFRERGPNYFFPKCHRCGAQTTENGRKPWTPVPGDDGTMPAEKGNDN